MNSTTKSEQTTLQSTLGPGVAKRKQESSLLEKRKISANLTTAQSKNVQRSKVSSPYTKPLPQPKLISPVNQRVAEQVKTSSTAKKPGMRNPAFPAFPNIQTRFRTNIDKMVANNALKISQESKLAVAGSSSHKKAPSAIMFHRYTDESQDKSKTANQAKRTNSRSYVSPAMTLSPKNEKVSNNGSSLSSYKQQQQQAPIRASNSGTAPVQSVDHLLKILGPNFKFGGQTYKINFNATQKKSRPLLMSSGDNSIPEKMSQNGSNNRMDTQNSNQEFYLTPNARNSRQTKPVEFQETEPSYIRDSNNVNIVIGGSDSSFDQTPPEDDISEHVAISSSTKKQGTSKMTLPQVTGKLRSQGVQRSPMMLTGDQMTKLHTCAEETREKMIYKQNYVRVEDTPPRSFKGSHPSNPVFESMSFKKDEKDEKQPTPRHEGFRKEGDQIPMPSFQSIEDQNSASPIDEEMAQLQAMISASLDTKKDFGVKAKKKKRPAAIVEEFKDATKASEIDPEMAALQKSILAALDQTSVGSSGLKAKKKKRLPPIVATTFKAEEPEMDADMAALMQQISAQLDNVTVPGAGFKAKKKKRPAAIVQEFKDEQKPAVDMDPEMTALMQSISASLETGSGLPGAKGKKKKRPAAIVAEFKEEQKSSDMDPEMAALMQSISASLDTSSGLPGAKGKKKKRPAAIVAEFKEESKPAEDMDPEMAALMKSISASLDTGSGLPGAKGKKKKRPAAIVAEFKEEQKSPDMDPEMAALMNSISASLDTGSGLPGIKGKKKKKPAAIVQSFKEASDIAQPSSAVPDMDDDMAALAASISANLDGGGLPGFKKKKKPSAILSSTYADDAKAYADPIKTPQPVINSRLSDPPTKTPLSTEQKANSPPDSPNKVKSKAAAPGLNQKVNTSGGGGLGAIRESKFEENSGSEGGGSDFDDSDEDDDKPGNDTSYDMNESTNKIKSIKLSHMQRGDSTGITYVSQKKQNDEDPLEQWMDSVATSLKVAPDQYTMLKAHLKQGMSGMAKRFSKAGQPKIDLLSEISALYSQYNAEFKLKKLQKALAKDNEAEDPIIKLQRVQKEAENAEDLKLELLKSKIQINMMIMAFRENQKQSELKMIESVNKHSDLINAHEETMNKFIEQMERQQKQLHFAFLFACPLVLSCGGNSASEEKFKIVPLLNYEKEYLKIKERLENAKCQIIITKRQCTIESFRQILTRKPLGIHFSGHGIKNTFETVGEFHYQHKDEGDFLLFETNEGDSQLVSRDQLKKLIVATKCQLEFVFVASCHSEFVGNIFRELGVKHVICINHANEVEDEAILNFTEAFYDAVFSNSMKLCAAFIQAQQAISISISTQQAGIFKLFFPEQLNKQKDDEDDSDFSDDDNKKKKKKKNKKKKNDGHVCRSFGKFITGMYKETFDSEPKFRIGVIDQPDLAGRQKDIFKLVRKLLSAKSNRLFNLIGLPGVGKSALARKSMQFIDERRLLAGGYIFMSVRGVKDTEVFVKSFTDELIEGYPADFSSITSGKKETTIDTVLEGVLTKLQAFQKDMIMILDNAEDLIQFGRDSFKKLISQMLTKVPKLKILLTSICRLQTLKDHTEEIVLLYELEKIQAVVLFQRLTRPIPLKESNELLKIKPDVKKYPSERGLPDPKKLGDHHFFRLLCGNPATITMMAPMLADTERPMTLVNLYHAICQGDGQEGDGGIMHAVKLGVHISIRNMKDDEESMKMLFLLSLLPSGIMPKDLDILWNLYLDNRKTKTKHTTVTKRSTNRLAGFANNLAQKGSNHKWLRPFEELKKNRLIEEKCIDEKQTQQGWIDNTLLMLPANVREVMSQDISETDSELFHVVLSKFFHDKFCSVYYKNKNLLFMSQDSSLANKLAHQIDSHQSNFWAFMQRLADDNDGETFTEPDENKITEEDSSGSDCHGEHNELREYKKKKGNLNIKTTLNSQVSDDMSASSFDSVDLTDEEENESDSGIKIKKMTEEEKKGAFAKINFAGMGFGDDEDEAEDEGFKIQRTRIIDTAKAARSRQLSEMMKQTTIKANKRKEEFKSQGIFQRSGSIVEKKPSKLGGGLGLALPKMPGAMSKGMVSMNAKMTLTKKFSKIMVPKVFEIQPELEEMKEDELAIIYYITNLVLLEQYVIVNSKIEKQAIRIKDSSVTFKGNVARLLALCKFKILEVKCIKEASQGNARGRQTQKGKFVGSQEYEQNLASITKLLKQAQEFFDMKAAIKSDPDSKKQKLNRWGMALTLFQESELQTFVSLHVYKDKVTEKQKAAVDALMKALEYFERLQHFRGVEQSYKLRAELEKQRMNQTVATLQHNLSMKPGDARRQSLQAPNIGFDLKKSDSQQITPSPREGMETEQFLNSCVEEEAKSRKKFIKTKTYFVDEGQYQRELLVERQQGASFSLVTEIVRGVVRDTIFTAQEESEKSEEESVSNSDEDEASDSDSFGSEKKPKKKAPVKPNKGSENTEVRKSVINVGAFGKMETIKEDVKTGKASKMSDSFSDSDDDDKGAKPTFSLDLAAAGKKVVKRRPSF